MVERGHVKKFVNSTLFCSLIILYYIFYMDKAVRNYAKGSTTIVQRQEEILDSNSKSPVFVLCVDPPFKTSFFRDLGINKTNGAEKYFWAHPMYENIFENRTFHAMDIYTDMSYHLEDDLNIFVYHFIPEYVNLSGAPKSAGKPLYEG